MLIMLGSIGMILLVTTIIIFVIMHQKKMFANESKMQLEKLNHRQQLMEAEMQVAEKEREKIAKNLHDDVGSKLSIINQNFDIIKQNSDNRDIVNEMLENSANLLEIAIDSSRNIIYDLMPPALLKLGYLEASCELCNLINASKQIIAEYEYNGKNFRFSPKIELQLYRITQEVLNNILKHSQASKLIMNINIDKNLVISILHNGQGITSEKVNLLSHTGNGIGLRSIQSRVQTLNASISYATNNNESKVIIEIPDIEKQIIHDL